MVVCPQCSVKHHDGDEFCRECGSFLLSVEDPASDEQPKVSFLCPKCQILYKKGSYCPTCGSLLMRRTVSPEAALPLQKKSVKRCSKQWLKLLEEEEELKSCISNLEAQRDQISADVLNLLLLRYNDRLESLSPVHQEIETHLESIRKRASDQIDDLEKELKPIHERLSEFRSLNKSGAVTKPDFLREKKELKKEIKSREKDLKKYRQILSLLPSKMGGHITSSGSAWSGWLIRPFVVIAACAIILMAVAWYLLWPQSPQANKPISKEAVASAPTPPLKSPNAVSNEQDVEKISSLFENIRQANLRKDIDLFISCFSRDFNGMEAKRRETLKMWENYNYLHLSYDLKKKTVSGDTANVTLEWLVRTSQKKGGQQQDGRTVLEVTLRREEGLWKIKEIKSLS